MALTLRTRTILSALVILGLLVPVSGVAAPTAGAVPTGGTCVPQPVSGADAELSRTPQLLDGVVVGLESRISMADAALSIPDPRCEGRNIAVTLTYRWAVTGRPAGSTASLTQTAG